MCEKASRNCRIDLSEARIKMRTLLANKTVMSGVEYVIIHGRRGNEYVHA